MNLNEKDSRRFYNIWFNLLDYTNDKYKVAPNIIDLSDANNINPNDIAPIRNKLWSDKSILEEVISANPFNFSQSDILIIDSWKNCISDKFILIKHLKKYSVFLNDKNIYGVIGIISSIDEMFPANFLPLLVETVLLPFEGKIIYDSLLMPHKINFGPGARKGFLEEYRNLKRQYGIISSL